MNRASKCVDYAARGAPAGASPTRIEVVEDRMVSEREMVRMVEEYHDLDYGQQIEARINDADIPVGVIGTVLRRIEVTGNWQCVFDIDGRRRVVALCGDQLRPVGQVNHDPVLRLVAAAHDPQQYDDQTQQEINKESVQRLTTDEAKQRRADGLRRYHERRKAEKEATPEPANQPAQDRDWLNEAALSVRRVIASAAVSASGRELELLVETALYLERGGAA